MTKMVGQFGIFVQNGPIDGLSVIQEEMIDKICGTAFIDLRSGIVADGLGPDVAFESSAKVYLENQGGKV